MKPTKLLILLFSRHVIILNNFDNFKAIFGHYNFEIALLLFYLMCRTFLKFSV